MSETIIFIGVGFVLFWVIILIADVYLIKKKGKQASISAYVIRGSKKYPMLVFAFGFILGIFGGHLFWSMDTFDWALEDELTKRCMEFLGR